jgi:hypothetical protein
VTDGNAQASIRSTDAELVRVTLNLPRSVLDKVERLAAAHGVNKTSIIVRAIELEDFLDSITRRGGKLLVEKANGDINEVIFR